MNVFFIFTSVAVLATVSDDGQSAVCNGDISHRRYSVCAHVDPSPLEEDISSISSNSLLRQMSTSSTGECFNREGTIQSSTVSASSRTEILKPLFNKIPFSCENLSVYSCGDSIGITTEENCWGFVKSSPNTFSLCGYQKIDTKASGPSTCYDSSNNFLW